MFVPDADAKRSKLSVTITLKSVTNDSNLSSTLFVINIDEARLETNKNTHYTTKGTQLRYLMYCNFIKMTDKNFTATKVNSVDFTAQIFTKKYVRDSDENASTVFSKCDYIFSLQKEPVWPFLLHHRLECDKDVIISSFSCNHFDYYFVC